MSKINLKLKAVIFDMDCVITNTMPDHYAAWKTILKKEGLDVSHYDIYSREGQQGLRSVRELFAQYDIPYDDDRARRILKEKEELFKRTVKIRFITGARTFLKTLRRIQMPLALVTGTSRHEFERMLPDSIKQLFDVVVTGTDVKHGKPHPEPFRTALRRLKIPGDKAVAIENAPFGIQSAKQAGIQCLALETSLPRKYLTEAEHVFVSFKEMRNKINFVPN
jgi:beta-phosphoglucomutase